MDEPKTLEALKADWWERWWSADYSWRNLKLHFLGEHSSREGLWGEKTLQDYWRRDPKTALCRRDDEMLESGELLISPDGNLWHLAHVPLRWKDGTLAKQGWDFDKNDQLNEILLLRLTKTGESEIEKDHDGRAQFSGIVVSKGMSLRGPSVSTMYQNEIHVKLGSYFREENPLRLVCRQSWLGSLKASNSIFDEEVDFSGSFFSEGVSFFKAVFRKEALFNSVIFAGETSFDDAHFCGDTAFKEIMQFGSMHYQYCKFHENINFKKAKLQQVSFLGAEFVKNAYFLDSEFSDANTFMNAKFHQQATFDSASFADVADFTSASFVDSASFRKVLFKQGAKFQNIKEWGLVPSRWIRAFFASKASGLISFEGGSMPPLSAFDGLHLESGASLVLDDPGYKKMTEAFSTELAEIGTKSTKKSSGIDTLGRPDSVFYSSVASGCRSLKKYFDSIGDKDLFQRFARFELEARMKSDEIGWLEERVFAGYRLFSDFGASIVRPFAWLACSVPIFAMLYWVIGSVWLNPISSQTTPNRELYPIQTISEVSERFSKGHFSEIDTRPMLGAANFSFHRTFPFGAWDVKAEDKDNNMRKLLLGDGEGAANFTVRVLATIQSIFSIAMIFLAGLAIRRRFKMD